MKIIIPEYTDEYCIFSIALDEHTKKDLLSEHVKLIYVQEKDAVIYPEGKILTNDENALVQLKELNNYDVVGISDKGILYRYYDDRSVENSFFITEKCNSNCVMCPSPDASRKRGNCTEISDLITIASHIPSDASHITITGGEPFMAGKRIFELLDYCREKFQRTEFLILTNARIFAVYDYCEKLRDTMPKNTIVGVPIHGSCAEVHDALTRVKNSFDQTLTGLERLQSLGVTIEIRIVVCKMNVEDIEAIARLIVSRLRKVQHVNIMAMEMTGNAYINAERLWIPYRKSFEYVKPAIDILVNAGIDVNLYNYPLCTVEPNYRMLCAKSISTWKVRFATVCDSCYLRDSCGGIFAGSYRFESNELEAVTV